MKMYRAFRRYLTQQRISSFLVIFALILASCDSEDVVTDPDWCYTLNYLTNDYETNFTEGGWESGVGFIPNGSNDLRFSYSNGETVNAAQVIITVARPEGVTGDITGAGNGIIFGITPPISPFPLVLASELETAQLPLTAEGLSDSGTTMNISVSTDKPFAIQSIHVRGWGDNPFPFNECPKGTQTATATSSPTNISTALPTSTGTETPTTTTTPNYTPTPGDGWCYADLTFDGDYFPFSYAVTTGSIEAGAGIDGSYGVRHGNIGSYSGAEVAVYLPDDVIIGAFAADVSYSRTGTNGGNQTYAHMVYRSGSNYLVNQPLGGPGFNPTWIWRRYPTPSGSISRSDIGTIRINPQSNSSSGAQTWIDNFHVRYQRTGGGCYDPVTPTVTPSLSPAPTLTSTPTPSRTPVTLTPTISPTPTRTLAPVIVPSQTPPPATSPPTLVYPSLTPNPGVTNTPVPNTPAPGTPSWTGTPNMTATSLAQGTPFPGAGVNPGDGAGLIGDIGGLGTGMIGAGSNIMSRATGWMNSVTGTFTNVVNGYFYAIPQAPPSVPRCATQPLESELCAIYFFLTHTVLSGTVGSVIIPLATIVVTLVVLLAFIRLARAILGRAMEATKS